MALDPNGKPDSAAAAPASGGWLDRVERLGNALPDPVMIFVALIVVLMALSAVGAALGWQATNPVTSELLSVKSLFGEDLVRKLLT
ncbi:MAG: AbgT family transporter, partial [Polymorphobacter sp.]